MGLFDTIGALFSRTTSAGLPADKQSYVGRWQGETMSLSISATGDVDFKQTIVDGSTTRNRSVTGAINSFEGDSFTVGVPGSNTKFELQAAPHKDSDSWKMRVDGEELRRVD